MKKLFIITQLSLFIILISCSTEDQLSEFIPVDSKNTTDCALAIDSNTLVEICLEGTDFAQKNDVLKFASSFYVKNEDASNSEFEWSIQSGSMEIVKVDNYIEGDIAKSIATIEFGSSFSGSGLITVNASNGTGKGRADHIVTQD